MGVPLVPALVTSVPETMADLVFRELVISPDPLMVGAVYLPWRRNSPAFFFDLLSSDTPTDSPAALRDVSAQADIDLRLPGHRRTRLVMEFDMLAMPAAHRIDWDVPIISVDYGV